MSKVKTTQNKSDLFDNFVNDYSLQAFIENNDIEELKIVLTNVPPKYEPIKADIICALEHANEINPIQSLRITFAHEAIMDWDNDDAVSDMISLLYDKAYATCNDSQLSMSKIIENISAELNVYERLYKDGLLTDEAIEQITAITETKAKRAERKTKK